jgi:polyisoprenoid-binding protein YceI
MPKWLRWVLAAAAAVIVIVVGGTWLYINVIRDDPPPRLSFEERDAEAAATTAAVTTTDATATTSTTASTTASTAPAAAEAGASDGLTGSWNATPDSVLGYRVKEILFGQDAEGVGRTNAVTGQLVIDGTTVTGAEFTVDMTTVQSDESRRDNQFNGSLMDTATFPTSTFVLSAPIELGTVPADRQEITATATGDLTLRGETRPVTFDVTARRNGANIEVNGSIPIRFEEWGIPNPSRPGISTEDNGLLEFLLVFSPA